MKKKKVAFTAGGLLAAPVAAFSLGAIVSCDNRIVQKDDEGIYLSSKNVEVNHNSGIGEFDIITDEQPADNNMYVYITTAAGPHHVELLDPDERVYHGHPAILYKTNNGITHVRMGFTEFVGESTQTVISLEVRYNNRKGEWVLKHIYDLNLTITYTHEEQEEIHIFALNDFHGVAEGYGEEDYQTTNFKDAGAVRIMNAISPVIESHPGSFLVTAGDNNAGDMFSTAVHGESIFKVLKAMGARYSAVGNHAFEWGITPMATYQFDNWGRTEDTLGNYFLASNILNGKLDDKKEWISDPEEKGFDEDFAFWNSQRVVWADPYKIVNMNGHLVCLVGLTTDTTPADGNKSVVDNLSFIDYNSALNYSIYLCQQESDPSLFNNIESFVLLTHIEGGSEDKEGTKPTGPAAVLATSVENEKIDAVISGHSHSFINGKVYNRIIDKDIWVGQAETEGRKYLDLTFKFDNTKPIGQRKVAVDQNVYGLGMEKYDPEKNADHWQEAHDDLEAIKNNPSTPMVTQVNEAFREQSRKVLDALKDVIATRHDTLKYPAVEKAQGGIGHGYYINQHESKEVLSADGGYIIDQLGAWINYAMLGGFYSKFKTEIEASSIGLTYPSIAMINQDTVKIQYDDKDKLPTDVTLRDMYNIQTYENPTKFGYITIWQLANIINHSLAGGNGKFNYKEPGKGGKNYYAPYDTPTQTATDRDSLNNLSCFITPDPVNKYVMTADPKEFQDQGKYKDLDNTFCLYPCGPAQMYGVRFNIEPATADEEKESGRKWKIATVATADKELAKDYPYFPDLYILDPKLDDDPETEEVENAYSSILEPERWLSAEIYYKKYREYIPMVTNSFLFDGSNWQLPLVKVYMNHNENYDTKAYPIINFSQITRDLLIEFCNLSKGSKIFDFDMSTDIVDKLVKYPWEVN